MTKTNNTKHALLSSVLALMMCIAMLIGSTFAWFTDNVSSKDNKIKAGNLDIQLLMADSTDTYNDISNSTKPIFGAGSIAQNNNAETLWEPGKTQVAYLAIKNSGNLALKYKVALNVENVSKNLYEVMEYDIIADAKFDSVKTWESGSSVVEGMQIITTDVPLVAGAIHYFALAIHMKEEAGNNYQSGQVDFDLTVLATQDTVESDSFNNQYDANAKYPLLEAKIVETAFGDYSAQVKVPAGAPGGDYTLDIPTDKVELVNNNGQATLGFDMTLLNEGNKVSSTDVEYPVTIKLPHPFVDNVKVLHNGEPVDIEYDAATHTITFTTTNFSPFEIQLTDYVDPSFELEYNKDNYTIVKGMFLTNPVDSFVGNLGAMATIASDCIAVDFEKDGVTYYVVSKKATTVFVAPNSTTEYVGGNGTFAVNSNQSGKLYSVISGLQSNEHSTLYLLPGTYSEATTINVYSNMDIIGLGDTAEIKVLKGKSQGSNRHLFNCNGSQDDYIHVTIRNMTLEVSCDNINKNGKAEDNAAVQSIRKTKVKCYNLVVNKAPATTTWENAAFYVNANNAVDGVKYPAYLYVENTIVNATNANYKHKVYALNNSSKTYFNHFGLMYDEGTKLFDTNSGNVKNISMTANDWEW